MRNAKFVLVLGATGGIGHAICHQLAENGWSIYLHYNTQEKTASILRENLADLYPDQEFICIQADLREAASTNKIAESIFQLHAVVVASGQPVTKLLTETSMDDMQDLWKVHVQHPAQLLSVLSNRLRKHNVTYVVFIGSIWGNTGAAGEVMYSAVKGAQHAFVKAYAKEVSYAGIRVNAIAPGWIETRMNAEINEEEKAFVMSEIPLLIPGKPKDVAHAVAFLLSGKADYMTGEVMKLNGGWYM